MARKAAEGTEKVARNNVKTIIANLMKSTGKSEAECRAMAGFPPPAANLTGKNVTLALPEATIDKFKAIAAKRLVRSAVVMVEALEEWLSIQPVEQEVPADL